MVMAGAALVLVVPPVILGTGWFLALRQFGFTGSHTGSIAPWLIAFLAFDIVPTRRPASPGRPTRSSSAWRSAAPPVERWRSWWRVRTSSAVAQSGKRNSSAR